MQLQEPTSEEQLISDDVVHNIRQRIQEQGDISFAQYMDLALYMPGLGYYSSALYKFGKAGDFVTAPEISPLFSHCVARQCMPVLSSIPNANLLEFGAGSGRMAADILVYLKSVEQLPQHYYILELSAELRLRQQQTIQQIDPELLSSVVWLDALPENFHGVILANEVLDAMPVHRVVFRGGDIFEQFVKDEEGLRLFEKPVEDPVLMDAAREVQKYCGEQEEYITEINLAARVWINSLAECLQQGLILLIDYAYSAAEYYHPQRTQGTLLCHFHHLAHDDVLRTPGIQDITAHVDFTAIAEAAVTNNLQVAGYTTQAQFLLANGLAQATPVEGIGNLAANLETVNQIKRLTLPGEMGDIFKVMALTLDLDIPLSGFMLGDLRNRL